VDLAALPDGTLLLALNDNATARSPLALAASRDGGATWRRVAVLEDDPDGNFHYPTVIFMPGRGGARVRNPLFLFPFRLPLPLPLPLLLPLPLVRAPRAESPAPAPPAAPRPSSSCACRGGARAGWGFLSNCRMFMQTDGCSLF
jgi:hypothetical protein